MAAYRLPPGPKPLPIVGNILQMRKDPLAFVTSLQRIYGDVATFYLGKTPAVLFTRPEAIRYILIENARNFTNREATENLRLILGDGLLSIDGEFHRQQRRMVQPAFHKQRVEGYRDAMVACTERILGEWQAKPQVDMAWEMMRLTMHIVAKALFNVDLTSQSEHIGQALSDAAQYANRSRAPFQRLRINLPFTAYGKYIRARRFLDETVATIITRHRSSGEDTGDVISMLLSAQDEDGGSMTDKQVRDETLTLLAAGHATTANTLTWTFYLLSQHPPIRERLLDELQRVLGGRAPTVDDLAHLPYLDLVIKESMRLYPPAWAQARYTVGDFEYGSYHIPHGTIIILSQWVTHRLPDLWPEPEQFKPERFDPEQGQKYPPQAYFPFGAGSRICIGMPFANLEARILLATILQRYVPRLIPGFPVVPQPMVTLFPRYGMVMELEPAAQRKIALPA